MIDLNLKGRKAIVCGSSQGIGKSTAIELAEMGAHVTLVARNEEALKKIVKELPGNPDVAHDYLVADFMDPSGLEKNLKDYLKAFDSWDILINNTGGPPAGKAIDANLEAFRVAFNAHLICNQIMAQNIVPLMKKSGYGRIVNIISTSVKQPIPGLGVSNTIRGAVANWSKTLSLELGEFGITVNNVLPGATQTQRLDNIIQRKSEKAAKSESEVMEEMKNEIPAKRFAKPEEVAQAIAFLCTESAAYINGINIPVDGGRTSNL